MINPVKKANLYLSTIRKSDLDILKFRKHQLEWANKVNNIPNMCDSDLNWYINGPFENDCSIEELNEARQHFKKSRDLQPTWTPYDHYFQRLYHNNTTQIINGDVSFRKIYPHVNLLITPKANKQLVKSANFRLLLSMVAVEPNLPGYKFFNWYDFKNHRYVDQFITYKISPYSSLLDSHLNFVEYFKNNQDVKITEKSVEYYVKFMNLVLKYPGETFVPRDDISIVWQAHILDRGAWQWDQPVLPGKDFKNVFMKDTTIHLPYYITYRRKHIEKSPNLYNALLNTSERWRLEYNGENYLENYYMNKRMKCLSNNIRKDYPWMDNGVNPSLMI